MKIITKVHFDLQFYFVSAPYVASFGHCTYIFDYTSFYKKVFCKKVVFGCSKTQEGSVLHFACIKSSIYLCTRFFFIRNLPQGLVLKVPYL